MHVNCSGNYDDVDLDFIAVLIFLTADKNLLIETIRTGLWFSDKVGNKNIHSKHVCTKTASQVWRQDSLIVKSPILNINKNSEFIQACRNMFWLFLDKICRLILTLTVGALLARKLGPVEFGVYSYAVTVVLFFQGVTTLGADGLIVRDLARFPSDAPVLLGSVFVARALVGMVCWLGTILVTAILRSGDFITLTIVSIMGLGLVFQSAEVIDVWFQSQSRNQYTVRAKIFVYLFGSLVRCWLIFYDCSLWKLALVALFESVLLAVTLLWFYLKNSSISDWRFNFERIVGLLNLSWPFMVSGLAIMVYTRIDFVLIREILGEGPLGQYATAVAISQLWNVIPVTLCVAFAPFVARRRDLGIREYYKALFKMFRVFSYFAIFGIISTEIFGGIVIDILYGKTYLPAKQVLSIHVWSNLFIYIGVAQSLWLVNENLGRVSLYRGLLGAVVSILANSLLIPCIGLVGAAISTLIAMACGGVFSNIIWARDILRLQFAAFLPWGSFDQAFDKISRNYQKMD